MVYRIYVEKKPGLDNEAKALLADLKGLLKITGLEKVRVFNRYDVDNIEEGLFKQAVSSVFSEPQLDNVTYDLPDDGCKVFAVEYLPGQFDQRADSACQCIQLISQGDRPIVKTAKVYALYGDISESDIEKIKKYTVNPVEARLASLEPVDTLVEKYALPTEVKTLDGFTKLDEDGLRAFINEYSLAMDEADIAFCRDDFRSERRDPTITELRMIDTYWSDHCRHTTFLTTIDDVRFEDEFLQKEYEAYLELRKKTGRTKPVNLMDIGTIGAR